MTQHSDPQTTNLEIPALLDKRVKTPKASPTLAAAGRDAQPSSLSSQAAPADAQVGGASLTGEKEHAHKSPSSFKRLMLCAGSFVLSKGLPDTENEHSRSGSIAHAVAAHCLQNNTDAIDTMIIDYKGKLEVVPEDMRDRVQGYLDHIRERAKGHTLLVEQRLELSWLTGEPNAYGTADAVIFHKDGKMLEVWDLKDGFIYVDAENNSQLRIYALCAARQFDMVGDYETVISGIYQPRIDNVVSETLSLAQLADFEKEVQATLLKIEKAEKSNSLDGFLHPSVDACKYCKAALHNKCPALTNLVSEETGADFEDETQDTLIEPVDAHAALLKADLIETWIKGCRAKVEADLLTGKPSKYWKLVEGKQGDRAWIDEADVEKEAEKLKLAPEIVKKTALRTPADMEKKLKKNPDAWKVMQGLYSRKKGKISVAAISDKRTKYDPKPGEDFSEVTDDE